MEMKGSMWILETMYFKGLMQLTHDRDIIIKRIKIKDKTFKPVKGKISNKNMIIYSKYAG